ncbi:nucleoside phosphorylase domain-containing protein [Gorgonomyces haynaldii]|nr:nucleoside phosphorylase domain-containing protein [Gorgonomyces haynaldii]
MTTPNHLAGGEYFDIKTYNETTSFIRSKLPQELQVLKLGIVLGSGLHGLAEGFDPNFKTVSIEYKDIPHFAQSTVPGHAGRLLFGMIEGKPTVMMAGRKHLYEGHPPIRTVYPIRIMKLLGVETVILTNAAGGLNPQFNIGDFMIIADHVAFAGMAGSGNALIGPNVDEFGPRFPPVSTAYDFDLRLLAVKCARALNIPKETLREGVYTFVAGPSFETRAEARFLRDYFGADAVGMSTVPEVVTAIHCGLKVLAMSLITNKVATSRGRSAIATFDGLVQETNSDEKQLATHEEVLETSRVRSQVFQTLVKRIIKEMN